LLPKYRSDCVQNELEWTQARAGHFCHFCRFETLLYVHYYAYIVSETRGCECVDAIVYAGVHRTEEAEHLFVAGVDNGIDKGAIVLRCF
jgi:hypothetical protein